MALIDIHSAPSASMRRWFGLSLSGLLLIFANLFRISAPHVTTTLLIAAFVVAAVYYSTTSTQLPIIRFWQRLTFPVAWLISHLLLGGVFFVILLPMAIIARLLGYDPLRLRGQVKRQGRPSNWSDRDERRDISRYFKQF